MSVDTSWDIESYRTSYECEEHWTLKREFMEAHKDRIPERRLICLAQAFVNIELLGCKYPDRVMREVSVLASDVGKSYRENKKNMLQRTFVKASDAAGAKVKGTSTSTLLDASSYETSNNEQNFPSSGRTTLLPPPPVPPVLPMPCASPVLPMDTGRPSSMTSLLGPPPTSLASRLPIPNEGVFIKGGESNPSQSTKVTSNSTSSMTGASNVPQSNPKVSSAPVRSNVIRKAKKMTFIKGENFDPSKTFASSDSPSSATGATGASNVLQPDHNLPPQFVGSNATAADTKEFFSALSSMIAAGTINAMLSGSPNLLSTVFEEALRNVQDGGSNFTSFFEAMKTIQGGPNFMEMFDTYKNMHGGGSNAMPGMPNAMNMQGAGSNAMPGMPNAMNMQGGGSNAMPGMPNAMNMQGAGSNPFPAMLEALNNMQRGGSNCIASLFDAMQRVHNARSNPRPSVFGGSINNMQSGSSNGIPSIFGGSMNMQIGGSKSTWSVDNKPSGPSSANDRPSGPPNANDRPSGPSSANDRPSGPSNANDRPSGPSSGNDRPSGPSSVNDRPSGPPNANDRPIVPPNPATLMFPASLNSSPLIPSTTTTTATNAATATARAPAAKKKKAELKKALREQFIRFITEPNREGMAPDTVKTASTEPVQYSNKPGETSTQPTQPTKPTQPNQIKPGQASKSSQIGQASKPSQTGQASSQTSPNQFQHTTGAKTQSKNFLANWVKQVGQDNPLAGFVIVRNVNHPNVANVILNASSCFSKIPINYQYQKLEGNMFQCTLSINNVDIVTSIGTARKKARSKAVVDALAELPKHCFTLKVNRKVTADRNITLDHVASSLSSRSMCSEALGNSVGSRMMKQMGWTGGGLGKQGTGIIEPIRPSEVFGRRGLGHGDKNGVVTPEFKRRVKDIVQEFARNSNEMVLAFSSEFSKEQRAEIHMIARLCHLKSSCKGTDGKNRCLTITRKVPAQELLLRLLQEGSNEQYELLPPTNASL